MKNDFLSKTSVAEEGFLHPRPNSKNRQKVKRSVTSALKETRKKKHIWLSPARCAHPPVRASQALPPASCAAVRIVVWLREACVARCAMRFTGDQKNGRHPRPLALNRSRRDETRSKRDRWSHHLLLSFQLHQL